MSNGEILKIRPDIYQAMLLDDILHTLRDNSELLGDIVKKLDAIIPEGILENIKDLNIFCLLFDNQNSLNDLSIIFPISPLLV